MVSLIRCPFLHVLPQCRWQVTPKQAYTIDPTKSGVSYLCCPGIVWWEPIRENELTRNSSGNTRPQSSQLDEPLWGMNRHNLPPKSSQARKKATTTTRSWYSFAYRPIAGNPAFSNVCLPGSCSFIGPNPFPV